MPNVQARVAVLHSHLTEAGSFYYDQTCISLCSLPCQAESFEVKPQIITLVFHH